MCIRDSTPTVNIEALISQPTAICKDGTNSFSQSRRGTCSGHGGVLKWISSNSDNSSLITNSTELSSKILNIVDGDTIDVDISGIKHRVRLLGVDTPEKSSNKPGEYNNISDTDCLNKWAIEATNFASSLLPISSSITLKFDHKQETDMYGRLLAYLHLPNDSDFNQKLISNGLARVYEEGNSTREEKYLKLQNYAIENRIGLWQCLND